MRRKTIWAILPIVWTAAGIINIIEGRASSAVIAYDFFAAALFAILFIVQGICDKKGEDGKKLMKKIYIGAIALVVAIAVFIFIKSFI